MHTVTCRVILLHILKGNRQTVVASTERISCKKGLWSGYHGYGAYGQVTMATGPILLLLSVPFLLKQQRVFPRNDWGLKCTCTMQRITNAFCFTLCHLWTCVMACSHLFQVVVLHLCSMFIWTVPYTWTQLNFYRHSTVHTYTYPGTSLSDMWCAEVPVCSYIYIYIYIYAPG